VARAAFGFSLLGVSQASQFVDGQVRKFQAYTRVIIEFMALCAQNVCKMWCDVVLVWSCNLARLRVANGLATLQSTPVPFVP
jgi:hypothetical protein